MLTRHHRPHYSPPLVRWPHQATQLLQLSRFHQDHFVPLDATSTSSSTSLSTPAAASALPASALPASKAIITAPHSSSTGLAAMALSSLLSQASAAHQTNGSQASISAFAYTVILPVQPHLLPTSDLHSLAHSLPISVPFLLLHFQVFLMCPSVQGYISKRVPLRRFLVFLVFSFHEHRAQSEAASANSACLDFSYCQLSPSTLAHPPSYTLFMSVPASSPPTPLPCSLHSFPFRSTLKSFQVWTWTWLR